MPISEFVYRRRVQFKETDASGIVHFSSFFVYAEEAEHAMWRSTGLSVEPRDEQMGWPRVSASFEFFKALRFEDEIEVRIRVVGRTSKTFSYQALVSREGELSALGRITTICVRKQPGQPLKAMEIPPEIAARFDVVAPFEPPPRVKAAADKSA
jgi:YbgC/YbaW family acyl-CoA thioester hydrolase